MLGTLLAASKTWAPNIRWDEPSWDLFILLFFVVAALLYGISLGRDRIIVILVSIYMALAVINSAPYLNDPKTVIAVSDPHTIKIASFVLVFVALFFLLSRSALLSTVANSDSKGKWWEIIIFSFLHIGLLISITLSFLPKTAQEKFTPFLNAVFVAEFARFFWIVMPIVFMILLKGGAAEKRKYKYDV